MARYIATLDYPKYARGINACNSLETSATLFMLLEDKFIKPCGRVK